MSILNRIRGLLPPALFVVVVGNILIDISTDFLSPSQYFVTPAEIFLCSRSCVILLNKLRIYFRCFLNQISSKMS